MVSGRFPTPGLRDLRARVAWDPIHNKLAALPGTVHLALVGGGTIPDTGQYPVYLGDAGPRLGETGREASGRRGEAAAAQGREIVGAGPDDREVDNQPRVG